MRYCTRLFSLLLLAWLFAATAQAEGISVSKVDVRLGEDGYQLSASYDVNLNATVQQALSRGIPLYFVGEFSLTRPRWNWLDEMQRSVSRGMAHYFGGDETTLTHWSWLDKEVYTGEQTVKLSYNVLTRQYRISRGALFQNFASFEDALNILSRQSSAVIPRESLEQDGDYVVAVRLRLDVTQLPNLLQVNALTGSDWTLDSDWYRLVIHSAEIAVHDNGGVTGR
ncbi:MAG: DUF4390 domain-containing protein [Nitrosomonadales bacterium]|nr:DUF4390 domain-containing protein [Nitrosomonadales bacterium]